MAAFKVSSVWFPIYNQGISQSYINKIQLFVHFPGGSGIDIGPNPDFRNSVVMANFSIRAVINSIPAQKGMWFYNSVKVNDGGVFGGFLRQKYLGKVEEERCKENKFGHELEVQGKLAGNYTFHLEEARISHSIIIEGKSSWFF